MNAETDVFNCTTNFSVIINLQIKKKTLSERFGKEIERIGREREMWVVWRRKRERGR